MLSDCVRLSNGPRTAHSTSLTVHCVKRSTQRVHNGTFRSNKLQSRVLVPESVKVSLTMAQAGQLREAPATVESMGNEAEQNGVWSDIDSMLDTLSQSKKKWANLEITKKIEYLKDMKWRLLDNPIEYIKAAAAVHGNEMIEGRSSQLLVGEVAMTSGAIDGYIETLQSLAKTGKVPEVQTSTLESGQQVAHVMENNAFFKGSKVDMYIQPGKPASCGRFYSESGGKHDGRVRVILGAGNQSFLGTHDILHAMFSEGDVVIYKHHPVQSPTVPYFRHFFAKLKEDGFFFDVECDIPTTQKLVYDDRIDGAHMTGGTKTHDAIVWGSEPREQQRRKKENDPLLKVEMTSELGCITPYFLVPGPWTDEEMGHHVRQLSTAFGANAGSNCLAAAVVFISKDWSLCDKFLDAFREEWKTREWDSPYYPGVQQRYDAWAEKYPNAEKLGGKPNPGASRFGNSCPPLMNIMDGLPESPQQEYACTVETFGPTLTIIKVPSPGIPEDDLVADFVPKTVEFANKHVWGNLSCTVVVDPATQAKHEAVMQSAFNDLEYGAVAVNVAPAFGYMLAKGYWGGFAGNDLRDVQSGIGAIHNVGLFDHPQKAVVHTPFVAAYHLGSQEKSAMPMFVARLLAGLIGGGLTGVFRMLFK